jgi:hypothetical protein
MMEIMIFRENDIADSRKCSITKATFHIPRQMLIKCFWTDLLHVPLSACGELGKDSPAHEIIFAFFAAFTLHSL